LVPDAGLRDRFESARSGLVPEANLLGCEAALAAYRSGQPWLDAVLGYLEANRDFMVDFVRRRMPRVAVSNPEGTYLAWVDCREAGLNPDPATFFLERAHVALSDGRSFGAGGEGFVRVNFGCPRPVLAEALERMASALDKQ
jgi:cystathionine beta-lyase